MLQKSNDIDGWQLVTKTKGPNMYAKKWTWNNNAALMAINQPTYFS